MSDALFDISGQVAVITGGTGVLGAAMARGLAQRGVRVALLGRNQPKGEELVRQITAVDGEACFVSADVTVRDSCEQAASTIQARWGRVDILVNAAGGNKPGATVTPDQSFFDLPASALADLMNLNVLGTLLPSQIFGRTLARQAAGSIINISSMAALRPLSRVVGYSASKAAIANFTSWLSVYMCQQFGPGIRVNAIAPGFFLTEQNRFLLTDEQTGQLTARGRAIIDHTPMGRFGEADELVGTLVWLVSPAARFVTGIVVPVDGGFSACSGI